MSTETGKRRWKMDSAGFHRFVRLLVSEFDEVMGPVSDAGVIRLRPIQSDEDLPTGIVDIQEAGTYRTERVDSPRRFSFGLGPDSLKSIVHPPVSPVWTMRSRDGRLLVDSNNDQTRRLAVIGVRACDVRALAVLERTQTDGPHPDPGFAARRDGLFLVVVDCSHPAPTCFCDSAGGGPAAVDGFDVALSELESTDGRHASYIVRSGSERGLELLARLALATATAKDVTRAETAVSRASQMLVRELPADAAEIVADPEHPHWSIVADRCLMCGNCTAVCPTCFCTDMHDEVSLDGETATRHRVWDTCFSSEYSALGGAAHRASPKARYRQWLMHKLGTWHEQYGESGCVGCGRCITWCPVGIDITAEVESLGRPVTVSA